MSPIIRPSLLSIFTLCAACSGTASQPGATSADVQECGGGTSIQGVDVSEYQGRVDWASLRASGRAFAFIRASDGADYADPTFDENWSQASAVGMVRGAYQFFRAAQDPVAQADLLLSHLGTAAPDDLPPTLDIESDDGVDGATLVARVGQWLDRVQSRTGRKPIVYTSIGFWEGLPGTARFSDRPLWIANYGVKCPYVPKTTWSSWRFWQYADNGRVGGVGGQTDLDVWNGTLDELHAFASQGSAEPIEVYWARQADGSYDLRALAPADVVRVEYRVDSYTIGSATRADGDNFPTSYRFYQEGTGRLFEVIGYAQDGQPVAHGVGSIDVSAGTAFYIKQMGRSLYEIGLERAPSEVAAVEVRADGYLLTDSVTGQTHSSRDAVRSAFTQLGPRTFVLSTFNADGTLRGTWTRSFTLE